MDFTYRLDAEGGDTEAVLKTPAPAGAREGKNTMIFAKPGIPSDSILLKAEASRR